MGIVVGVPAGGEVAVVYIVVEYAHFNGLQFHIHIDLRPHLLQNLCYICMELAVGVEILELQVVVLIVAGSFHQGLGLFQVEFAVALFITEVVAVNALEAVGI